MKIGEYTGIPWADYISERDKHVIDIMKKENASEEEAIRRWDCEFPEKHQCLIDEDQTLFEGNSEYTHHHIDTVDKVLGNCEYKQNSLNGVRIGSFTYEQLINGVIDNVIVWEWSDKNKHKRLYENVEVSYKILGVMSRQYVIDNAVIVARDYKGRPIRRVKFKKGEM